MRAKFSRKFSAKVPQLETKSPTVEENFLENFSRQSHIQDEVVTERVLINKRKLRTRKHLGADGMFV